MPKPGTLPKARIVEAVVVTNGYTQQKAHETIEILLGLIKRSLESGHRKRSNNSTQKSRYIQMVRETERKT